MKKQLRGTETRQGRRAKEPHRKGSKISGRNKPLSVKKAKRIARAFVREQKGVRVAKVEQLSSSHGGLRKFKVTCAGNVPYPSYFFIVEVDFAGYDKII